VLAVLVFLGVLAVSAPARADKEFPPSSSAPAPTETRRDAHLRTLHGQALVLEREGRGVEAVEVYGAMARQGDAGAATRMAEIYDRGLFGVARDPAQARRWHQVARVLLQQSHAQVPVHREWQRRPDAPQPDFYAEAVALEQAGNGAEAVAMYARAVRSGNSKAALRLWQIYNQGMAGVKKDRAEALKWYNAARALGEEVPPQRP
jgi:TPR repeat protein